MKAVSVNTDMRLVCNIRKRWRVQAGAGRKELHTIFATPSPEEKGRSGRVHPLQYAPMPRSLHSAQRVPGSPGMEGSRSGRRRERDDDGLGRKRQSLTVPICKDFVRGRCSRSNLDCRYAHPPPIVALDGSDYFLYPFFVVKFRTYVLAIRKGIVHCTRN